MPDVRSLPGKTYAMSMCILRLNGEIRSETRRLLSKATGHYVITVQAFVDVRGIVPRPTRVLIDRFSNSSAIPRLCFLIVFQPGASYVDSLSTSRAPCGCARQFKFSYY